jgi:tetratricopeptide (TPR) repeat protein
MSQIRFLNIMLVMLGSLLLGGCGWSLLMSAEERAAAAFQSGTDAYESGEFSQAIGFFRQVPPESALYNQAVQMTLKIPFQKGLQAFEMQDYDRAVREFRKIDKTSPDYEKAQRFLKFAILAQQQEQFQDLEGEERIKALGIMSEMAVEIRDPEVLSGTLELVSAELSQSSSASESEELMNMMGNMISVTEDPLVRRNALHQILGDFKKLHRNRDLRPQMFRLIAQIKVGMP